MLSIILKSSLAGTAMGIIYGLLFTLRIKKFFIKNQQTERPSVKKFFRRMVGSTNILFFLSSYALVGILLYIFITIIKINLLISTLFFFLSFWIIVWRYAGKLL